MCFTWKRVQHQRVSARARVKSSQTPEKQCAECDHMARFIKNVLLLLGFLMSGVPPHPQIHTRTQLQMIGGDEMGQGALRQQLFLSSLQYPA